MQADLAFAKRLAQEAGDLALRYYDLPLIVEEKPGASGPVTQADREVNSYIIRIIRKTFPKDAILAEESENDLGRLGAERVWMVDPIDGTREFIARSGEFSTMIGLAVRGKPTVGALYQPTRGRLFFASLGGGAFLEEDGVTRQLHVADTAFSEFRLAVAKPWRGARVEMIRQALGVARVVPMGSGGLKLVMIAAGEADLYVNPSGRLAEWDTCAPEVLIHEAGGRISDLEGNPLSYNRGPEVCHKKGVLASHGRFHDDLLRAIDALRKRMTQEGRE